MQITEIILRKIRLKRKAPFLSSRTLTFDRQIILITVKNKDGLEGHGECSAPESPKYCEEWTSSAWEALHSLLVPLIMETKEVSAKRISALFAIYRGNKMAKASIESAIWELESKAAGLPLWKYLGGKNEPVPCGVALGIAEDTNVLLDKISEELDAGYKRIKLKIQHGADIEIIGAVRNKFPQINLMVDANGAYQHKDIAHLKKFDHFNLMMLEQPFKPDDLFSFKSAQKVLNTKICMDETIVSNEAALSAIKLGLCSIINLKLGRVGGYTESKSIIETANLKNTGIWCGGQHESGLGKAHNLALATLMPKEIPSEISASSRYWDKDIIIPELTVDSNGMMQLPHSPGVGFSVDKEFIEKKTIQVSIFKNKK